MLTIQKRTLSLKGDKLFTAIEQFYDSQRHLKSLSKLSLVQQLTWLKKKRMHSMRQRLQHVCLQLKRSTGMCSSLWENFAGILLLFDIQQTVTGNLKRQHSDMLWVLHSCVLNRWRLLSCCMQPGFKVSRHMF